jgi:hypothetical protein
MRLSKLVTTSVIACSALALNCAAPASAPAQPPSVPVGEVSRYAPFENNTVFSYETYIEDTNEHGILVFEISRPRPELAELSVAGRVRKRYYFEPGGIRSSQGGYLLKAPLTANAEWQGDDGQVKVTAVNQDVTVPAGKFAGCIQTVEEAKLAAATRVTTTVFCPGVGITTLQIEGEQEGTSVLQRLSLKSFGPRFTAQ